MPLVRSPVGKILRLENGKLASECCCNPCDTCADSPDTLYLTLTLGASAVTISATEYAQPCSDGFGANAPLGATFRAWYGTGTLMYGMIPVPYKIMIVCICGTHYVQWQACGPEPAAKAAVDTCDIGYLTGMVSFGPVGGLPTTLTTTPAGACLPPGITDMLEVTLDT